MTPTNDHHIAGEASLSALPSGDDPIETADEDLLNRTDTAAALARVIVTSNGRTGSVVAVTGAWGSGKTSLLNLTTSILAQDETIRLVAFNPWLFSDAEQLAAAFFFEMNAQLRDLESRGAKARRIAGNITQAISDYSGALGVIPGMDSMAGAAKSVAGGAADAIRGDRSLLAQRVAVMKALAGLDGKIVVSIDDLDRLTPVEIRHIFRIVRLTASFPNVVYLLALDRAIIERALNEEGFSGRGYLDKILTVTCDVPALSEHSLRSFFAAAMQDMVEVHPEAPFDVDRFFSMLELILTPMIRTMRDVKRLFASLPLTLEMLRDEITLEDVVTLEAIRLFIPDMHALIDECTVALTTIRGGNDSGLASQIARFVSADGRDGTLGRAIIDRVFPAALQHIQGVSLGGGYEEQWSDSRRVAHRSFLLYYLRRQLPPGRAPAAQVAAVLEGLGDLTVARAAFDAVSDDNLEDVLARLLPFTEGSVDPDEIRVLLQVLLEQFGRLRTELGGMLDVGADFSITRPLLRLLRQLPEDERFPLCIELLVNAPLAFAAFELVTVVGHRENAGHGLVSLADAAMLEEKLRDRIRSTSADELASERHPAVMLFHLFRDTPAVDGRPVIDQLEELSLAAVLLADSLGEARSSTMGSALVHREYSLRWPLLIPLYGTMDNVRRIVERIDHAVRHEGMVAGPRLQLVLDLALEEEVDGILQDDED